MTSRALFDLERILAPVGLDAFVAGCWQREPRHVARSDPGFYADLFGLADLDALLVQSRMRSQDLRVLSKERGPAFAALANMDRPLPERHRGPDLRSLHNAFADGESIVVQVRRLSSSIDRLCRSAEQVFRRRASAELYLTPRQSQAFDIHFDLHDVFLLQLQGAKTWRVHEPVVDGPSPLCVDDRLCGDRVGEPRWVFEVRKGDLLYLPRGFPHQGMTSDKCSLHLTVGISAIYAHDLLKALVDVAARDHIPLRRPLHGAFADRAAAGLDGSLVADCLRLLASDDLIDKALERIEEDFLERLDPVPDGQFAEVDQVGGIDGETVLEWRPDQLCAVRRAADAATIHFVGGKVSGPPWLEVQLRWIATTPRFSVRDIPGDVSLNSKLVLARRLVKEGFLRRAGGTSVDAR